MTRMHVVAAFVFTASTGILAQGGVTAPTLADARKALVAATTAASGMKASLSCAIVDTRGDLVALERMDTARFFTAQIAIGKARASAIFGGPSGTLTNIAALKIDQAIDGQMLFLQGAVPFAKGTQRLGAIGCSGGSGQQDEDAAKAGLAAVQ